MTNTHIHSLGTSPLGEFSRPYRPATDALTKEVSDLLTKPSGMRDLFNTHIYVSGEENDRVATLIKALPVCLEADQIQSKLRKEKREPTAEEAEILVLATTLRDELVLVDVFDKHGPLEQQEGYVRPAIEATENWDLAAGEPKKFKAAA